MPARPESTAASGLLADSVVSQHDIDPTSHWLEPLAEGLPPLAIGVEAAETPVATAKAAMKETRGLESIIVKAGWSLW